MKIICVSKNFTRQETDLEKLESDELVMLIDFDRCIGCGACQFACQAEHATEDEAGVTKPRAIPVKMKGGAFTNALNLPLSCRHCEAPCEFKNPHNFWITCPEACAAERLDLPCDGCAKRLEQGLMPACATRCAMKCITFGHPCDVVFALNEKRLRDLGDLLMRG